MDLPRPFARVVGKLELDWSCLPGFVGTRGPVPEQTIIPSRACLLLCQPSVRAIIFVDFFTSRPVG
ncbi:hypothetical protein N9P82_01475, partial [bacterium]|nr:hypothetical protein [bacterium]